MNFTNRFPYTTLNNINLDWIIKRVKELGTTVRSYAQDIASAAALAETAQEAAESVTSTAESAVASAQAAEATANAIAGTANTALATAQAAETTAQAAETTANAIAGTANTALATAQAAVTTAQAAESAAQAAEESADNAETIAGTASANASNAVQTANTALATAQAALVMAGHGDAVALNEKAGKVVDTESGVAVSFVPDRTIEQNLATIVTIVPAQAGSGNPSINNIRAISGRDIVNIWNKPAYDTTENPTVTVQLGQTVYGGSLDVANGTMIVERAMRTFVGAASEIWSFENAAAGPNFYINLQDAAGPQFGLGSIVCNQALSSTANGTQRDRVYISGGRNLNVTIGQTLGLSDVAGWKSYLAEHPLEVVYTIANPFEITFTPAQIAAIVGQTNNVWSDAGNVTVEFAADLKWYIDKEIAELQALVLENGG